MVGLLRGCARARILTGGSGISSTRHGQPSKDSKPGGTPVQVPVSSLSTALPTVMNDDSTSTDTVGSCVYR